MSSFFTQVPSRWGFLPGRAGEDKVPSGTSKHKSKKKRKAKASDSLDAQLERALRDSDNLYNVEEFVNGDNDDDQQLGSAAKKQRKGSIDEGELIALLNHDANDSQWHSYLDMGTNVGGQVVASTSGADESAPPSTDPQELLFAPLEASNQNSKKNKKTNHHHHHHHDHQNDHGHNNNNNDKRRLQGVDPTLVPGNQSRAGAHGPSGEAGDQTLAKAMIQASELVRSLHGSTDNAGIEAPAPATATAPGVPVSVTANNGTGAPGTNKRGKSTSGAWAVDGSEAGGAFTLEEEATIDAFMSAYMREHGLTRQELCQRVWASERRKDAFWDEVSQTLPHRTRASVYKHVRRAYHVFESRGKWTPDEDEQLRRCVEERGAQWREIGLQLGRMPEDCRDRWRNYVKCGNQRAQNRWTFFEEEKLREIVTKMMEENPGGDINWTVVSERMNGVRSRIQCRYKWNKISNRSRAHRVRNMLQGDRLALIEQIKHYESENEIDWDRVATAEGRGVFTGEDFQVVFKMIKDQVPGHDQMSFQHLIKVLYDQLMQGPEELRNARVLGRPDREKVEIRPPTTATPSNSTPRDGYVESWTLKN
uniref:ARAD1D37686p n=1 Tax=Blastobotrys adeninivorans TaxID=409370 RepID=A0A060TCP2_BLAAD